MIDESAKFGASCSHYKDTCDLHYDTLKCRDRLLFSLLCILCLFIMQSFGAATEFAEAYTTKQFGIPLGHFRDFVSPILWFSLMGWGLRYFQINVDIERNYAYLHKLEGEINSYYAGGVAYTREGKSYLHKYPLFSSWLCFIYTSVFPIFLISISLIKSFEEFWCSHRFWILDTICCGMVIVSTIFYMFNFHGEPRFLSPVRKFLENP